MIWLTLLGLALGGGLVMMWRSVRPQPVRLGPVISRLNRPYVDATVLPIGATDGVPARITAMPLFTRLRGVIKPQQFKDLRVMGRTVDRHVFEKLTSSLALLVAPLVLDQLMRVLGTGLPGGAPMTVVAGLGGAAFGFVLPDILLRSHAAARRRSFEHALSSYVDLVNVLLAGGAGVETALTAAAEAGDGTAFAEIRHTMMRAQAMRRSHWDTFAELGEQLGVEPLIELAASMQLAGEQGARVRQSLASKAAALRARQVSQIEAAAESASERMGLPLVVMFLGYLILLTYPAFQQMAR